MIGPKNRRLALALVAALAWAPAGTIAQTQIQRLAEVLKTNQKSLQHYTWTSRTTITIDGEQQSVKLFDARLDDLGAVKKTPIPGATDEKKKGKKKKKKAAELTDSLKLLIDSYIHPTPERLHQLVIKSNVYHGRGESGTETLIQSRNVLYQGDSMDIWIDGISNKPNKLEILTSHQGEPVHLVTRFDRLEDRTAYPATTTVKTEVKEKKMVILIENFDYVPHDEG